MTTTTDERHPSDNEPTEPHEVLQMPPKGPAQASHDTLNPPEAAGVHARGLAAESQEAAAQGRGLAELRGPPPGALGAFRARSLVVPTGHEKVRSNDTNYRFRPGSDFYYLTGNLEPDCVLVLVPSGRRGTRRVLFVEPNPGAARRRSSPTASKGELWVGPRLGVRESRDALPAWIARCGLPELRAMVSEPCSRAAAPRAARLSTPRSTGWCPCGRPRIADFATALSEMRLLKDALEMRALQRGHRLDAPRPSRT